MGKQCSMHARATKPHFCSQENKLRKCIEGSEDSKQPKVFHKLRLLKHLTYIHLNSYLGAHAIACLHINICAYLGQQVM